VGVKHYEGGGGTKCCGQTDKLMECTFIIVMLLQFPCFWCLLVYKVMNKYLELNTNRDFKGNIGLK
jgi:hypothetical protein